MSTTLNLIVTHMVIKRAVDGAEYRILFVEVRSDQLILIPMKGRGVAPQRHSYAEWMKMQQDGQLVAGDDPSWLPSDVVLTPGMEKRQARAWSAIKPLALDVPNAFNATHRRSGIAVVSKAIGKHPDTIRDWLTEYWQSGCDPQSLYGAYFNCGAPGKHKPDAGPPTEDDHTPTPPAQPPKKRGAKRTMLEGTGCNVTQEIRDIFEISLRLLYCKKNHTTLMFTYIGMLSRFFRHACTVDTQGNVTAIDPEQIPTYEQFTYWYRNYADPIKVFTKKYGQSYYNANFRELLGNSTYDAIGPGYRFQIDSTILDIQLVASYDNFEPVGRATFHVVGDCFSHLIAGFNLSEEPASWKLAMLAIYNTTVNKVEYCKSLGIEITEDQWPTTSLPNVILGDRGELASQHANQGCEALNIEIETAPPFRPDMKGMIEVMLGVLQRSIAPFAPGYISKISTKRGQKNPILDACLTLEDAKKMIVYAIILHNTSPLMKYPKDKEMIEAKLPSIPALLWKWGIDRMSGTTVHRNPTRVKHALLPTKEVSVTEHGIVFEGRQYSSSEYRSWFSRIRIKQKAQSGVISYDPDNIGKVLFHDKKSRSFIELDLLTNTQSSWGTQHSQVKWLNLQNRKTNKNSKFKSLANRINIAREMEKIAKEARERVPKDKLANTPKRTRTGNVRRNRSKELAFMKAQLDEYVRQQRGGDANHQETSEHPEKFVKKPIFEDDDEEE